MVTLQTSKRSNKKNIDGWKMKTLRHIKTFFLVFEPQQQWVCAQVAFAAANKDNWRKKWEKYEKTVETENETMGK